LRGGRTKGWQAVIGVIVPVLDDAIERSMSLAAGMESRGYGSTRRHLRHPHRVTALMIAALVLLGFGAFLLLGLPRAKAGVAPFVCLAAGVVAAVAALRSAGTARSVTRYRPDPWGAPEWAVVLFGLAGLGAMVWLSATAPGVVSPPVVPAAPPVLHPAMLLVAAAFVGPLAVTSTPAPHGGRS
ncbi:MAG: energy-coupling factor transporter transmembrane protein EcfT, partial [Actinomycetia bacterium]|nr:energy-coupling factor transporter transmembrane protein EcfT [Actinomycetes bacterium]